MNNLPQWLNLLLAALTGAVIAAGVMIRLVTNFDKRLQRIENQDLEKIIDGQLAKERHDNLYPMLQVRVFAELDKIENEQKMQGQNVAVLLERDRTAAALEKIASSIARPHG